MADKTAKVVNCSALHVRSGAGTSYSVLKYVKKGDSGIVTDSKKVGSSTWYKWKTGGWSNGKYLKITKPASNTKKPSTKTTSTKTNKKKSKKKKSIGPKLPDGSFTKQEMKNNALSKEGIKGKKYVKYMKKNVTKGLKGKDSTNVSTTAHTKSYTSSSRDKNYRPIFTTGYSGLKNGKDDFSISTDYISKDIENIKAEMNLPISGSRLRLYDAEGNAETKSLFSLMHNKFNRFKLPYPDEALPKTFGYVFFTRPALHLLASSDKLLDDLINLPDYYYMFMANKTIFRSLTAGFTDQHNFHPFLSNVVTSFDITDESIDIQEHGESNTGHKVVYGSIDTKSTVAGSFNVNFVDNKRLEVYKTVHLWQRYISDIKKGVITPTRNAIINKVLDYAASAYYFLLGPDGEEILYWSKFTGVFPTASPSAEFSWKKGELMATPNYSIPFAYSWKKDEDIYHLAEFNTLSAKTYEYREIYDPHIQTVGTTWVGAPFVETSVSKDGDIRYKLRFRV